MYTGFTSHANLLDRCGRWPNRWTTTWKFSQAPVTIPVRDLADVDVARTVPVRRFTWRTDQHHRPGLEYLVATGRHHAFESREEECLLLVADFATRLVEALSQPFRLRFSADGRPVQHTPDFLLLTQAGLFLIDVRPAGRIRPSDAVKFAATAEMALSAGWWYGVITGWRGHVLSIVDAVSAQRRTLTNVLGIQDQLREAAADGPLQYGELAEQCSVPAVGRAHALHLVWRRHLGLDMSVPFGDTSLVRLAPTYGPEGER
ncbi:TnsA-like heteromeric transposase endonuclease subunit [Streptomyces pristinaespiralis]|uniref:TnsA-like heteromeric transposase endonuclease subunit n=1 Tax=Streptomyces pristinaespiralis TaxID=38300 RepID=UPI0033FE1129